MKFHYWRTRDKQWHWHLKAKNGKIVCQAEGYKNRADCIASIEIVRGTNASTPITEDVLSAPKVTKPRTVKRLPTTQHHLDISG